MPKDPTFDARTNLFRDVMPEILQQRKDRDINHRFVAIVAGADKVGRMALNSIQGRDASEDGDPAPAGTFRWAFASWSTLAELETWSNQFLKGKHGCRFSADLIEASELVVVVLAFGGTSWYCLTEDHARQFAAAGN